MGLNIKDINGNSLTSFSIGDDGIVYGFMGGPNTGYKTTSLDRESCENIKFTFNNEKCYWRSEIYDNKIISDTFNSVFPIKFSNSDYGKTLTLNYEYVIMVSVNNMEDNVLLGESLKRLKIEIIVAQKNSKNIIYTKEIFNGENISNHLTNGVGVHVTDYSSIQTIINNVEMTIGSAIKPSKLLELWTNETEEFGVLGEDLVIDTNKEYSLGYRITNYFNGLHLKIDNILLDTKYNFTKKYVRRYTKNPSFEFERFIDNKKVWGYDEYNRKHEDESHSMQYSIGHEGEVLNTKELELALTPNDLLVNEFWKIVLGNKSRLAGLPYNGEGDSIPFYNKLDGVSYNDINTLEEFKTLLFERLTNPITLRGVNHYNALQTLYNRLRYRFEKFSEYDFPNSMNVTKKIDKYWLDVIEEFVPSTSLWGSSIKISNNVFQDNKFKYKTYSINTKNNEYEMFNVDVEYISNEQNLENDFKTETVTVVNNLVCSASTMNYGGVQETFIN